MPGKAAGSPRDSLLHPCVPFPGKCSPSIGRRRDLQAAFRQTSVRADPEVDVVNTGKWREVGLVQPRRGCAVSGYRARPVHPRTPVLAAKLQLQRLRMRVGGRSVALRELLHLCRNPDVFLGTPLAATRVLDELIRREVDGL